MQIEITQEDIDKGVPEDGAACPIARAVKRETGLDHIEVGTYDIWRELPRASGRDELRRFPLPFHAVDFIERFDDGKSVQPFSFDLDVAKLAERPID